MLVKIISVLALIAVMTLLLLGINYWVVDRMFGLERSVDAHSELEKELSEKRSSHRGISHMSVFFGFLTGNVDRPNRPGDRSHHDPRL